MRNLIWIGLVLVGSARAAVAQVAPGSPVNGPGLGEVGPPAAAAPEAAAGLGAPGAAQAAKPLEQPAPELSLPEWSRDDWMLLKPRVALLEIDGYLRLQSRLDRRLDLGNGATWEVDAAGDPLSRYGALSDGAADISFTSMRLRVEPLININEQLQIITTFDLLDNLLLGSTPSSLAFGQTRPPLSLATRTALAPQQERNSLSSMLAVKRVWGRATALGEQLELRFGRMPDHWGLGMLYNDGDGLQANYGTVVDRVSLAFRLYHHVLTPMVDWVSKGLQYRPFGAYDPQPVDAVSWDDTMQYGLRISREDHAADIRDSTLHGDRVLNYGLSTAFRVQPRQYGSTYWLSGYDPADPTKLPTPQTPVERRDAFLYIGDAFAKYYVGNLQLLAELAVQAGSFTDTVQSSSPAQAGPVQKTTMLTIGGAVEARYHLRTDTKGTRLSLLSGAASGDNHAGFGALDLTDTQRGGNKQPGDRSLHNFQFSPDYQVDLLLFRRLIGTVTDAWYLRPEVAYRFSDRLEGKLSTVYSQVMRGGSASNPGRHPLGLELDAHLGFGLPYPSQRGQLLASLDGGMLFPLAALSNPSLADPNARQGKFAWTIQSSLALAF
jgi:uncharacterized protein (TIGR04551 family)